MKFPKIGQFRHVVESVRRYVQFDGLDDDGEPIYDETRPLPTLTARGTVKLNGTNVSVVLRDGRLVARSRTRELTVEGDHFGFAAHVAAHEDAFRRLIQDAGGEFCAVYGEWCGSGVQRGTAINQLDRMFVCFASVWRGEAWFDIRPIRQNEKARIFNIADFGIYTVDVDFNNPAEAQVDLEWITSEIVAECPVGKRFGVSGRGEGTVWTFDEAPFDVSRFWFKVKGEKHRVSKTKSSAGISPEVAASIDELADATATQQRFEQGVGALWERGHKTTRASTGAFIKWVLNDIAEEEADRLEASGLTIGQVSYQVTNRARAFWLEIAT